MKKGKRRRASLNLLGSAIFCIVFIVAFIIFLIHDYIVGELSFAERFRLCSMLMLLVVLFVYLICMPRIHFDDNFLYITQLMNTKSLSIGKAKSIEFDGKYYRGFSTYILKYYDENNEIARVKFRAWDASPALRDISYKIRFKDSTEC
jgi:Ca2+/Na+ antiporter